MTVVLWIIAVFCGSWLVMFLSLIHLLRCRRIERCRSRWSPYHSTSSPFLQSLLSSHPPPLFPPPTPPPAAMMSQQQQSRSSPHHHIHSPRAVTSSPRASFSPNSASGNKSPVMPALSNYGVMGFGNASGSQSPGGACRQQQQSSPCPSPDSAAAAAAMCYSLWPPNSPKNMYPTAGDHLMDSAMSTNSDNQQQQQEYNLLRALMESQLEYYNSFSRSRRSSPSAGSPQPGPSTY